MTEETNEKIKNREKSPSRHRDKSHKWDKVKVLKKVIIRRLPPSMTEETFLKQIEPLPDHENYYFVPADWSLGQDATARAYINFMNQDDIFLFKDRFDGYVFVDSKGAEYPAVVEFAPFQGLPRNKSRKKDPKVNTIESDPHYISFLESLNKEETEGSKTELKLEYSFQLKDDKKITSTPLLQYLANKKQERRDERKRKLDEKRRQREEERQRKKIQVSKNIPQAIVEEDTKQTDDKLKEKPGEKRRDREKIDDRKDSRNRRRDQRRKEEREKRMLKALQENLSENNSEKSENKVREDDDKKRSDSKKTNLSRRERQRSREESRRAESASSNAADQKTKEPVSSQLSTTSVQSNASSDKLNANDEVNECVRNFIKGCVVPKGPDTDAGLAEVCKKLEKLGGETEARGDERSTSSHAEKKREEKNPRRIRNRDRPSLEIYQPRKMRLPSSKDESGRSSSELKDYRSNPTSDCESIKRDKDEVPNVKRKVSRYSERRMGRAKEKSSKDTNTAGENTVPTDLVEHVESKSPDAKSEF